MLDLDLDMVFRPIDRWPGKMTPNWERRRAPFRADWASTQRLLARELKLLDAKNTVIQVALRDDQIRLDGKPRAAAVADHPGVIFAFDSKFGPLKYSTDRFISWQQNIRAIALSLEALRKVDRYGVSKRGEQYTGWKQISQHASPGFADADEAADWLGDVAQLYDALDILSDAEWAKDAYRIAAKKLHPDRGGDAGEFAKLVQAKELLGIT